MRVQGGPFNHDRVFVVCPGPCSAVGLQVPFCVMESLTLSILLHCILDLALPWPLTSQPVGLEVQGGPFKLGPWASPHQETPRLISWVWKPRVGPSVWTSSLRCILDLALPGPTKSYPMGGGAFNLDLAFVVWKSTVGPSILPHLVGASLTLLHQSRARVGPFNLD